jgi:secreted trypsin-like serine protease
MALRGRAALRLYSPDIQTILDCKRRLTHVCSMLTRKWSFLRLAGKTNLQRGSIIAALLSCAAAPALAVVGGDVVRGTDQARRFTVKIESSKGELCSGVVIQPRLVLTAAHCVLGGGRFSVTYLDDQLRRRSIRAANVVAHETFLPGRTPSTQPGIDLAMIRLAEPLPAWIQPVTPGGSLGAGEPVSIAGFGLGQEGRRQSARTLRQGNLTSAGSYTSGNNVMVAVDSQNLGRAPGAGACKGDSGGPIMRGGAGSTELVGIVSWSSGPASQRVRSVCGGYTAITPVADHSLWISRTASALVSMPEENAPAPRTRGTRQQRQAPLPTGVAEPWMRPDNTN